MTSKMRIVTGILLLCTLFHVTLTSNLEHYKTEGHTIMKRMAEADESFEKHDLTTVHLVDSHGRRQKRMTREDLRILGSNRVANRLQLGLSSGAKLNMDLLPADIGHSNTVVWHHTESGYEKGNRIATDCYFYGRIEDSSGIGWAAISHCDGVFGFASSPSYEYFFHPVGPRRSKRDADEQYGAHVLWRRAASRNTDNTTSSKRRNSGRKIKNKDESLNLKGDPIGDNARNEEIHDNVAEIVIEMAMFSDEQFYRQLHNLYPGREDDFLLTRLAGTQAMYGDLHKAGYDIKIKLKYLEYWKTNPVNYTFTQSFSENLKSFCRYTTRKYFYDIHTLNTGIKKWHRGRIGLAYVGGVCTSKRCFAVKGLKLDAFVGFGHELGHALGLSHRSVTKCPQQDKSKGFMGGGSGLLFTPCMKYKLTHVLKSGKIDCLLTEASESKTPAEYQRLPSLFPGQVRTPDALCRIFAGPGYVYVANNRPFGSGVCLWFLCLNEDKDGPEYLRAKRFFAPMGFPCRAEGFCKKDQSCKLWNATFMTLEPAFLRSLTKISQWTEWSTEISSCSQSCGGGVRVRRRECQYGDYNLDIYCRGMSVKPELCNTHPCQGQPTSPIEIRNLRRDEVCKRFLENNVRLKMRGGKGYTAKGDRLTTEDKGPNIPVGQSRSCLFKCVRDPKSAKGDLDAVLPDGTLCEDYARPRYDLNRLNIQMRCVRGRCHEFSDCPDGRHIKDDCGICDGDGSRCFSLSINPRNFARRKHTELTVIPHRSTNIDVYFNHRKGGGVILELWSHDDRNIIGEGGKYPNVDHEGAQAIEFAGTTWTYKPREAYLRAAGPTNETIKIKAVRRGSGVRKILVKYAIFP